MQSTTGRCLWSLKYNTFQYYLGVRQTFQFQRKETWLPRQPVCLKERNIVTQIAVLPEEGIHPSTLCPGIDVRDKHCFVLSPANHRASQAASANEFLKHSLKQMHTIQTDQNRDTFVKVKDFPVHLPKLYAFKRILKILTPRIKLQFKQTNNKKNADTYDTTQTAIQGKFRNQCNSNQTICILLVTVNKRTFWSGNQTARPGERRTLCKGVGRGKGANGM